MGDDASILHINDLGYTIVKLKGYSHDFSWKYFLWMKYYFKNLKH